MIPRGMIRPLAMLRARIGSRFGSGMRLMPISSVPRQNCTNSLHGLGADRHEPLKASTCQTGPRVTADHGKNLSTVAALRAERGESLSCPLHTAAVLLDATHACAEISCDGPTFITAVTPTKLPLDSLARPRVTFRYIGKLILSAEELTTTGPPSMRESTVRFVITIEDGVAFRGGSVVGSAVVFGCGVMVALAVARVEVFEICFVDAGSTATPLRLTYVYASGWDANSAAVCRDNFISSMQAAVSISG